MGQHSLFLLSCLVLIPLMVACQKMEPESESSDTRHLHLKVGSVERSFDETPEKIKINGVFVPSQQIQIKSEFDGSVADLSVAKGQVISAGDFLLRLEDEQLPLELERLGTELQAALAQLEQTRLLASQELPEEETEEGEDVVEVAVPELFEETFGEPVPTFSQLASEIRFTPVDAGGVWPGIDPQRIAVANDPEDAGGIWPAYGPIETNTGAGFSAVPELSPVVADIPNPLFRSPVISPTNTFDTTLLPEEIPVETDTPAITEGSEIQSRLALEEARVDVIRAELALREREMARRSLSSPISGRIHEVAVTDGSGVEAGDYLMEIYQVDPIEFSFHVLKTQVEPLEVGMEIKGQLLEPPGLSFEGEITFIGAELTADESSVEIRAWVNNPNEVIKVGMKGSGEILVKK